MAVKAKKTENDLLVVQFEMFFDLDDLRGVAESIEETLEVARQQAGAHVVGSYLAEDTAAFRERAVTSIELPVPTSIEVDRR